MERTSQSVRNVATGSAFVLFLAIAFAVYSGAVTFSNWPWTTTVAHTSGSVMGFEIGVSKSACFERALLLQQEGEIRALHPVDVEAGTYEDRFKGTDLTAADFGGVQRANVWRLSLAGKNAWLLLAFEEDRLKRVERKDYRGPTE